MKTFIIGVSAPTDPRVIERIKDSLSGAAVIPIGIITELAAGQLVMSILVNDPIDAVNTLFWAENFVLIATRRNLAATWAYLDGDPKGINGIFEDRTSKGSRVL
jgi:hypothetical protein